mmetsp:Transcript_37530/g.117324  ORF Transcript_37530/g.117324 Transcript_37530/m.117324 type:complete len:147 (-) Transcript_37530:172-612(-)
MQLLLPLALGLAAAGSNPKARFRPTSNPSPTLSQTLSLRGGAIKDFNEILEDELAGFEETMDELRRDFAEDLALAPEPEPEPNPNTSLSPSPDTPADSETEPRSDVQLVKNRGLTLTLTLSLTPTLTLALLTLTLTLLSLLQSAML